MILVVDDDVQLLETIRDVLSKDGTEVAAFSDPTQALAHLDSGHRPALIVSDVRMPGMDGFAFHREVTKRFGQRTIPFLFLSSLDDPDHVVAGLESGADDYVTKPIDWRVLRAKVSSILRSRKERAVPVFTGDLAKLPFVKLLQFCELRTLTGEIFVETSELKVTVPLSGGLLQEDDETLDLVGRLMDATEGRFEIRVRPPDFTDIAHAAVSQSQGVQSGDEAEPGAKTAPYPKPGDCPAGILTGIPVGERLVQVQTECVTHPAPSVVTVAILDGRTLTKKVLPVAGFDDRRGVQRDMREQHRAMERDIKERLAQKSHAPTTEPESNLSRFNELFEQGFAAYRAKDFNRALEAWRQASELDPNNKVVQVNLAMLQRKISSQ